MRFEASLFILLLGSSAVSLGSTAAAEDKSSVTPDAGSLNNIEDSDGGFSTLKTLMNSSMISVGANATEDPESGFSALNTSTNDFNATSDFYSSSPFEETNATATPPRTTRIKPFKSNVGLAVALTIAVIAVIVVVGTSGFILWKKRAMKQKKKNVDPEAKGGPNASEAPTAPASSEAESLVSSNSAEVGVKHEAAKTET
ncbi:hypothetical protein L596_021956 [Steinernema carpocapsae]|uniref:Syndecan/Neurexin domain-containing protein n=1 Tax=Steinernema carpocapsae TaxID=34508 RepID=A0A4U5MKC0_STECR|nr:hypothetical protein L596_021956 [Steinernema carpocapsae]